MDNSEEDLVRDQAVCDLAGKEWHEDARQREETVDVAHLKRVETERLAHVAAQNRVPRAPHEELQEHHQRKPDPQAKGHESLQMSWENLGTAPGFSGNQEQPPVSQEWVGGSRERVRSPGFSFATTEHDMFNCDHPRSGLVLACEPYPRWQCPL